MIDADYTAKNRVGTLTISTDETEVAGQLRDVFFAVREAASVGMRFKITVTAYDRDEADHA